MEGSSSKDLIETRLKQSASGKNVVCMLRHEKSERKKLRVHTVQVTNLRHVRVRMHALYY